MEVDRYGFEVLDLETCLRLVADQPVGRLGLTVGALPVILPVAFSLVDGDVVLSTGPGPEVPAVAQHEVACFEVDGIDVETGAGWSVLLTGRLREVVHPAELAAARTLPSSPWTAGRGGCYLRLHPQLVSGRRARPAREGDRLLAV